MKRILFGLISAACVAAGVLTAHSAEPFSVKVTGHGPPMILIPGLACGGDVWDGTVEHFQGRYECHVLTLAGFAGTPGIEPPFLDNVRKGIIDYIRQRKLDHPIIIGHSLGGAMTYWVAATDPKHVGPVIAVDGLPFLPAVMYPGATAETSKPFAEQYRTQIQGQTAQAFADSEQRFLATMITAPSNVAAVAAVCGKSDPKAVGEAMYEMMTTDLRPQLKFITAPVLLIGETASAEDAAAKAAAEAAYRSQVAGIPHHEVVFAPKARHFIQLDEPEFFYAKSEEFLKKNKAAK